MTAATEATGAMDAADATDAKFATGVTDATDTADATDTTDAMGATDATSATDATGATDATDAADATDATDATPRNGRISGLPRRAAIVGMQYLRCYPGPGMSSGEQADSIVFRNCEIFSIYGNDGICKEQMCSGPRGACERHREMRLRRPAPAAPMCPMCVQVQILRPDFASCQFVVQLLRPHFARSIRGCGSAELSIGSVAPPMGPPPYLSPSCPHTFHPAFILLADFSRPTLPGCLRTSSPVLPDGLTFRSRCLGGCGGVSFMEPPTGKSCSVFVSCMTCVRRHARYLVEGVPLATHLYPPPSAP